MKLLHFPEIPQIHKNSTLVRIFSVKVRLKCIVANVVCLKFVFANDGHVCADFEKMQILANFKIYKRIFPVSNFL